MNVIKCTDKYCMRKNCRNIFSINLNDALKLVSYKIM